VLLHRDRVVGAALDRRVVGHDHGLPAAAPGPMPVTMPALGTAVAALPWRRTSRSRPAGSARGTGCPGRAAGPTRSRTSSLPRAVCFSRADSEPPLRAAASRSRSSATRSRISSATPTRLAIINLWGQRYAGWRVSR
jgi:hypothetical protein